MDIKDLKSGDIIEFLGYTHKYIYDNDKISKFICNGLYEYILLNECGNFDFIEINKDLSNIKSIKRDSKLIFSNGTEIKFEREKFIDLLKEWYNDPDKQFSNLPGFKELEEYMHKLNVKVGSDSYACAYVSLVYSETECAGCPLPYCTSEEAGIHSVISFIENLDDTSIRKGFIKVLIDNVPE